MKKLKYRVGTFEDVRSVLDPLQPLYCDTETNGLYGEIVLLQCYQPSWEEAILIRKPCMYTMCAVLTSYTTVWHNSAYDLSTLQRQLSNLTNFWDCLWEDTFLLARLGQPQHDTFSLDDVMERVHGIDVYAANGLDKKKLQKSDWSGGLTEAQLKYAACDVFYLPEVYEALKDYTDDASYVLDMNTLKCCLEMQRNGMPIDQDKISEKTKSVVEELATIPMPINANSWQQVRKWLNVDKSDKKFLSELAINGCEKSRAVLEVRRLKKLLSFLGDYTGDTLYGLFAPSARSGRLASKERNLQQIPRALKGVFGYPKDSNRVIIFSDYPQLELRTICAMLNVKVMADMFYKGVDLHAYVASIIFGENFTPADRQVTKTYNFNLLYGGSVGMVLSILITYGLLVDPRQANRHKRKWLNLFSEINAWQQEQISQWRKGKLGSTPMGRRYKGKLMTDQMNIANQGAGAEVAKTAFVSFSAWLKEFNEANPDANVKLVNFIHDSYILDCPNDEAIYKEVAHALAQHMQDAWKECSQLYKLKDIPMPIDVAVGYNWKELDSDDGFALYRHSLN